MSSQHCSSEGWIRVDYVPFKTPCDGQWFVPSCDDTGQLNKVSLVDSIAPKGKRNKGKESKSNGNKTGVETEIVLVQREVAFLLPSKICKDFAG